VEKGFRENVLDGFGSRWAVTESTGLMDARVGCFVGPRLPRRYKEVGSHNSRLENLTAVHTALSFGTSFAVFGCVSE
jgi:hypothetical protein